MHISQGERVHISEGEQDTDLSRRSQVPKTTVKYHLILSESDGLMLLLDIGPGDIIVK